MDAKSIGNTIAELRKKSGFTQTHLAQKLGISSKTVSKWENGNGYPDIVFFPKLASLFGVSIDHLMLGEKKGIAIAGNLIADIIKNINTYPKESMMSYVGDISCAVGGCVPNTAINLAKIDRSIPLHAYGKVGTDQNGHYIVSELIKNGINTDGICYTSLTPTSFCDVLNSSSGERTFFHKKGANAEFCPDDIALDTLDCSIFHIGYILLLDMFDAKDKEYGTVMARFLHSLQKRGIKTSIDVVSDDTADYGRYIIPALKYCNYTVMNETECCRTFNMEAYDKSGKLDVESIKAAMKKQVECGVSDKVIVHCKKAAFILDAKTLEFNHLASLDIPKSEIKGSVGAGDAFCAGCLYGIYNELSDTQLLEFAIAAASCSLFAANSIDGMQQKNVVMQLNEKYKRMSI